MTQGPLQFGHVVNDSPHPQEPFELGLTNTNSVLHRTRPLVEEDNGGGVLNNRHAAVQHGLACGIGGVLQQRRGF